MTDFYEFRIIPFAPDYVVNRAGDVFHGQTNNPAGSWVDPQSGCVMYSLRTSEKWIKDKLSRILAAAFIDIPEHLKFLKKKLIVGFRDENPSNTNLDNLYWTTTKELQDKKWAKQREEDLRRHPLPKFDEVNTGLYPNAVECATKPGFYYIPFADGHVVISRTGELYNALTDELHPTHFSPKGYVLTTLRIGKKYLPFPVHRIVGLLFCKKPEKHRDLSFDDLQVNHKDGVKTNNCEDNLEWVTNLENMNHARDTGLFSKETKVLGRNLITGEIYHYRSISECARVNFLGNSNLFKHLHSKSAGRVSKESVVFKLDDGSPWPQLLYKLNGEVEEFNYSCDVVAEHVSEDYIYLFSSLPEACKHLGINLHTAKNLIARHGKNAVCGKQWMFRRLSDDDNEY